MSKNNLPKHTVISQGNLEKRIYLIRGKKVMLDSDLAKLYDVETKQLKRAIRRHASRFPEDFMFQAKKAEWKSLRCQIGTLNRGQHVKYPPFVFTEQGVAMLSSVLNSERAIQVNIQIMRAFVKMRELIASHKDLEEKIRNLERKMEEKLGIHDEQFKLLFQAFEDVKRMLIPPEKPKRKIGFR